MADDVHWKKEYEIGITEIDNQHKNFLILINNIYTFAQGKYKILDLKRLVEELTLYAKYHFFSEENHMLEIGYPLYNEHVRLHEDLLSSFSEMIFDTDCTNTDVNKLHTFLLDWFKTHTVTEDKKIREYEKTLAFN